MKAIILVAGIGSRLGNHLPKCLTPLRPGYTIMDHQLENLAAFAGDIVAVVGFRKELIQERHPGSQFAHNPLFDRTNTSHSLLAASPQSTTRTCCSSMATWCSIRASSPALLASSNPAWPWSGARSRRRR